jgi:hypothetical protein
MQFVNPYFLFGLLAVSIPIIIHLFNFRRFKKVFFTNVRFLKDIKTDTQKRSRLRHLIVLLLRIVAVISLVMAFAQPYIPVTKHRENAARRKAVSIYIDNSYSMEAMTGDLPLLDKAKKMALGIAGYYQPTDLFQLITNDFEGRHQRFVSRDELTDLIGGVTISPMVRQAQDVYTRLADMPYDPRQDNRILYFLSDFQKSTGDISKIVPDTSIALYLIPLIANQKNNLYIDSCWFESPAQNTGQSVMLKVRLKNSGMAAYEKMPVKLMINDAQKGLASFDIAPEGQAEAAIPFTNYTPGIQYGQLEINDYPVTYDDKMYLNYTVTSSIPVLCINEKEENIYLHAVLGKDSMFVFVSNPVRSLDFGSFGNYSLIMLNGLSAISSGLGQELQRFIENGGAVAVFPAAEMDLSSYQAFLTGIGSGTYAASDTVKTRITTINMANALYHDVFESVPGNIDLPVVNRYFPVTIQSRTDQEPLLTLQNGNVFASVQSIGKGSVYLFAVPLDPAFSNFPLHAIFVPTVYQMALLSQSPGKLYYTIGSDELVEVKNVELAGDRTFRIRSTTSDFEIIPEHRMVNARTTLYMHGQLTGAGNYTLLAGDKVISGLSFNYDRKESDLTSFTPDQLKTMWKNPPFEFKVITDTGKLFSNVLEELNVGIKLWKWFVLLALLCLAGEVVILRFF